MTWRRFIAAFDFHGDRHDPEAKRAFMKHLKVWKPDIRIFGGDLWDFRPLRKKASEEERRDSMLVDYREGMEFLKEFKPHYFIRGNHDERLWELAQSDKGIESDFAIKGICEIEDLLRKMRCHMLPYHKRDGVLRLGHLKITHGFSSGVYAARQHALWYGSILIGHGHSIDEFSIPGLERRVARMCGALCRLDMDYNARQPGTLKQAHGWAYGVINHRSGEYFVWQAEKINNRWLLADSITEL